MQEASQPVYGWRAKLGLIVPTTNTANEAEWCRAMPDGVSFHTTRMPLHVPSDEWMAAVAGAVSDKVRELALAETDVVAYACTADSMSVPPAALPRAVTAATGVPTVTTAEAIVAALTVFEASRICVATPFQDSLNQREITFFSALGLDVANIIGLGIAAGDHLKVPAVPLAVIRQHALAAVVPGSQALVITCTDFPCMPLIASLEAELGIPVVTSNQATLWRALRAAGVGSALPGLGRLLTLP